MFDNKHSLVRTIYLYLFALLGLALITVGTVRLVNLGLKTYVFEKADQQYYSMPAPQLKPDSEVELEMLVKKCENNEELSEEGKNFLAAWSDDYEDWKERRDSNERLKSQRQEKAANSLSLLIVGLPLFIFHWGVIRRESERQKTS